MKSLAVSIACAVGLASPGLCGDLGKADISARNDLDIVYTFAAKCAGPFDSQRNTECSVTFTDSEMSVDESSSIGPDRVVAVNRNWHPYGYNVSVQYITSAGLPSLAEFTFNKKTVAKQFLNTVFLFSGGNLPSNSVEANDDTSYTEMQEPTIDVYDENDDSSTCTGPTILCF